MSFSARHRSGLERLGGRLGEENDMVSTFEAERGSARDSNYVLEVSQRDLVQAITQSVLQGIQKTGIMDRHSEMLDAFTNIVVDPPDLQPIMRAIDRLDHSKGHNEVLEAINCIVVDPPDLSPIVRAIAHLEAGDKNSYMMEELRSELKLSREDSRRDLQALASDLRQDLSVLRQEILENRKETRSDAEVLLSELRTLPQAVAEMRQAMRKLEGRADNSEVINALRKVNVDPTAIANAVHARPMKVDHSELIPHLKRLEPDHGEMATIFLDRLKKTNLSVDHGEVLRAMNKIKVPDHHEIATSLNDRLGWMSAHHEEVLKELKRTRAAMEVDLSPVMDAINGIQMPDHHAVAGILHDRLRNGNLSVDHSEVLSAIKRLDVGQQDLGPIVAAINSAEVDLTPVHEAIGCLHAKVDHTPILDAIRRLNIPDHQEIAAALHDRLRKGGHLQDQSEVLREIKKVNNPDLSSIIDAINASEIDLSPVHEAISQLDNSVLITEIRRIKDEINQAEVDFAPVIEEIQKIQAIDADPVLKAISALREELLASRAEPATTSYVRSVSMPMVVQPPTVQTVQGPPLPVVNLPPQVVWEQPSSVVQPATLTESYRTTPRYTTMSYQPAAGMASPRAQAPLTVTRAISGSSIRAPSKGPTPAVVLGNTAPTTVGMVVAEGADAGQIQLEGFDATDYSGLSPRPSMAAQRSPSPTVQRIGPPRRPAPSL